MIFDSLSFEGSPRELSYTGWYKAGAQASWDPWYRDRIRLGIEDMKVHAPLLVAASAITASVAPQ